jgi:hypothetical protein
MLICRSRVITNKTLPIKSIVSAYTYKLTVHIIQVFLFIYFLMKMNLI